MAPSEAEKTARAIAAEFGNRPDALIEILHQLQAELGYVPEETVPALANALNLSRAEVHGVVTFYHDFRSEPAGRHVLKMCRAEACQAMGCEALVRACRKPARRRLRQAPAPMAASRWSPSTASAFAPPDRRRCWTAAWSAGSRRPSSMPS